jgi:hypothetical protein
MTTKSRQIYPFNTSLSLPVPSPKQKVYLATGSDRGLVVHVRAHRPGQVPGVRVEDFPSLRETPKGLLT